MHLLLLAIGAFAFAQDQTVPATNQSVPATDQTAPATDQTAPATDQTAPATDQTANRALALHESAFHAYQAGKTEDGILAAQQSLALHRQLKKKPEQAINLRLLAFLHDSLGERQKTLQYYSQALALARSIPDPVIEAKTLRDIGTLHYNLNNNATAIRYLNQSLALQRKSSPPGNLALTLFSTGELRRFLRQNQAARQLFEEALPLARASQESACEADVLGSLAMLDLQAGQFAQAQSQLDQALTIRRELKDLRGEASTLGKLGILAEAQGNLPLAHAHYQAAAAAYATNRYRGGEAYIRHLLAQLESRMGNLQAAADQMLQAINLAESLRQRLADRDLRATYIGYVQNRYEFLLETYLQLDQHRKEGQAARAFGISERARARALVEALADNGLDSPEDRKPTLSLSEIQARVLDPDTTLLEFSLGEKASHVFVVTSTSIRHFALPPRARLEAAARSIYERLRTPGPLPDFAVLRPWLPAITTTRLVVVPDGALQYLPFAALYPKAHVVLAPSASALAGLRQRPAKPAQFQLVTLADPVAPELARLPFSRQEARSLAATLPAGASLTLLGPDATPKAALAASGKILHLAAHSILNIDSPERTEIVLSGASLRMRDILHARLSPELVVLSACQTALGKEMRREGLLGLTRAFQLAGARRVVSSLWKIDDRAAAELMKHFYTEMFQNQLSADAALHAAQAHLRAQPRWAHPFYWAGFVLEGDWH